MKANKKKLLNLVSALSIALLSTNSLATAIAAADVALDWTSLSIAGTGLTMMPDSGKYANASFLGVSQAWFKSVDVPSADLPNLTAFGATPPVLADTAYSHADGSGSVSASLVNNATTASLHANATDNDGNLFTSNLINTYTGRSARYQVAGVGSLQVSLDYSMLLQTVGVAPDDWSNIRGRAGIYIEDYVLDGTTGAWAYLGSYEDALSKTLYSHLGEYLFSDDGTLDLTLNFDGAATHLVLLEMSAWGTAYANSTANGTAVPEPASLALLAIGLLGLAAARRRHA